VALVGAVLGGCGEHHPPPAPDPFLTDTGDSGASGGSGGSNARTDASVQGAGGGGRGSVAGRDAGTGSAGGAITVRDAATDAALIMDHDVRPAVRDGSFDDRNGGVGGSPTTPDGGPTNDGAGGTPSGVLEWTCNGDYAFRAPLSLAFTAPTPPALAKALTAISSGVHAVSLVLHSKNDTLLGAVSATVAGPGDTDTYSQNEVPPFAPAVRAFGSPPGVTTVDPQPSAFLHFMDGQGAIDVQVQHVVWRAGEGSSCSDVSVELQAVIPASGLGVKLHLPEGDRTIGELVRGADAGSAIPIINPIIDAGPPSTPVELRAVFQGEPTAFDFSTL